MSSGKWGSSCWDKQLTWRLMCSVQLRPACWDLKLSLVNLVVMLIWLGTCYLESTGRIPYLGSREIAEGCLAICQCVEFYIWKCCLNINLKWKRPGSRWKKLFLVSWDDSGQNAKGLLIFSQMSLFFIMGQRVSTKWVG